MYTYLKGFKIWQVNFVAITTGIYKIVLAGNGIVRLILKRHGAGEPPEPFVLDADAPFAYFHGMEY